MPTWSQNLVCYTLASGHGIPGDYLWRELYNLAHQVPGTTLSYSGVVGNRTVTISITSPLRLESETGYTGWFEYINRVGGEYSLLNPNTEALATQRANATALFKTGQQMTITVTSPNFAVYAEGSYRVERCKSRTPGGMFIWSGDPGWENWVTHGGVDFTVET